MKILILFAMIFAHIVDDYYLQGILAKMKQKKWWEENAPDELYKHDYIVALITHAFSWSFMITLPTLIVSNEYTFICFCILINAAFHAYIDNEKANKLAISLVQDQICHLCQIVALWLTVVVFI